MATEGRRRLAISGVYEIRDAAGRSYIGSSVDVRVRWREHKRALNANAHHNPKLQAAWLRDGAAAFTFEILQCVEERQLRAVEQYWIDVRKPWYNVSLEVDRIECSDERKAARDVRRLDREIAREIAAIETHEAIHAENVARISRRTSPKTKRVYARVSDPVYEILTASNGSATFTRLVEELGDWMLRENLTLDEAFVRLKHFFWGRQAAA